VFGFDDEHQAWATQLHKYSRLVEQVEEWLDELERRLVLPLVVPLGQEQELQ
jgi:hypothetical protein